MVTKNKKGRIIKLSDEDRAFFRDNQIQFSVWIIDMIHISSALKNMNIDAYKVLKKTFDEKIEEKMNGGQR